MWMNLCRKLLIYCAIIYFIWYIISFIYNSYIISLEWPMGHGRYNHVECFGVQNTLCVESFSRIYSVSRPFRIDSLLTEALPNFRRSNISFPLRSKPLPIFLGWTHHSFVWPKRSIPCKMGPRLSRSSSDPSECDRIFRIYRILGHLAHNELSARNIYSPDPSELNQHATEIGFAREE